MKFGLPDSLRNRVLFVFIFFQATMWLVLLVLGLNTLQSHWSKLLEDQKWWLSTYSQTFLNDIQVGSTRGVERKLRILVERGPFLRADLSFGKQVLSSARDRSGSHVALPTTSILDTLFPLEPLDVKVQDSAQAEWGSLTVTLDRESILSPLLKSLFLVLRTALAIFMIFSGLAIYMMDLQISPLTRLTSYIAKFSKEENIQNWLPVLCEPQTFNSTELRTLYQQFQAAIRNILHLEEAAKNHQVEEEISKVAVQVAHDIRSPLAALNTATQEGLSELSEPTRILIRSAVSRLRDIANLLLEKNRGDIIPRSKNGSDSVELIPNLVDSLTAEKRYQLQQDNGISLTVDLSARSFGAFARVEPSQFKTVLSNIIDNAMQALSDGKGSVAVRVLTDDVSVSIIVEDNGKGISEDLIPKIFDRGFTHDKEEGSGLGLYHAKQMITQWKGTIEVVSSRGKGSTIRICLPKAPAPRWFANSIVIDPGMTIVILDDDMSIHEIWNNRFRKAGIDNPVVHLMNIDECEQFLDRSKPLSAAYLFDYQILGDQRTGFDMILKYGLKDSAILITSYADDANLVEKFNHHHMKALPKSMAGLIGVLKASTKLIDAILIDDDELVAQMWRLSAAKHHKRILIFQNPDALIQSSGKFDSQTPIYVDYHLGELDGLKVSEELTQLGFKNVYLTTGEEADRFPPTDYLSGIIDKSPPWVSHMKPETSQTPSTTKH